MAMRRLLVAPLLGASLLVPPLFVPSLAAPAAAASEDPVLARAIAFLAVSQQDDGGFELAGFAGFETADAVLAIGLGAVPEPLDPPAGRARVEAVTSDTGRSGFDALDDEVESSIAAGGVEAGRAAKLAVLVAQPFAFDARAFDPAGDGEPVDLVAAVERGELAGGSYGTFSDTLYAVLALTEVGRPVAPATASLVRAGQQPNGGWDFAGDPGGAEVDIDTTSLAIQVLVALGDTRDDQGVARGLTLLGVSRTGGAWGDESGVNPNSTALAILAVISAGYDPSDRCWRDLHAPSTSAEFGFGASPVASLRSLQAPDGHIVSPFDSFGVNTFATSQSVQALNPGWLPVARATATCDVTSYSTVNAAAGSTTFTPFASGVSVTDQQLRSPVVGAADLPTGSGSWLFAADGGVTPIGDATFYGRAGERGLNRPIVGGAATPDGRGYWLVAADGGVFSFGSAAFFGSTGGVGLNQPVVGMAAAPDGRGYWLVAADGGIFSFGSARFAGSTGGTSLNRPVAGMAADPDGRGYWLVASDGGVFSFDAPFLGSTGSLRLSQPIVGIDTTTSGRGYAFVGADGGVFSFGDAPFLGSAVGSRSPVVALAFR